MADILYGFRQIENALGFICAVRESVQAIYYFYAALGLNRYPFSDALQRFGWNLPALPLPGHWGHAQGAGRQTLPGDQGMDGFFYALLERTS